MEGSPVLCDAEKRTIRDLTEFVEQSLQKLAGQRWMSQAFAEGACQHYGLPTDFIDFTADLDVAGFFADYPNTGGHEGGIAVLDLKRAAQDSGSGLLLIDLTRHPWARRPSRQSAYGVSDDLVTSDFKDPDVCKKLGIEWYGFRKNKVAESPENVARAAHLLAATDDVMAGVILLAVDEYVEQEGPLTSSVAAWLATRLSHVRLAQRRDATGDPGDPVLVTWSQTGLIHDPEIEKDRSISLWTGIARQRDLA